MALWSTMFESFATLVRPAIGRDAASGVTQNFAGTPLWKNRACSCQQAGASVKDLYAQRNTFVTNTLYFELDPGAEVNDILYVTDRTGITLTYQVQGEVQPVGRGKFYSVDTILVRQPGTRVAPSS